MKAKLTRQEAIYRLALAGISAAIALLAVGLSVLVRYSTIAFYVAAGLALMIPLSKRYYVSAFFAYGASAALGFVIAGDIFTVLGYVAYFGPIALLSGILYNVRLKWYFALPIKAVFINGVLALLYFVGGTFVLDISLIESVPYWALALVGTVILLAIDAVQVLAYRKLIPLVDKALRKVGDKGAKRDQTAEVDMDDDDPFEEELYKPVIFKKREDPQNSDVPSEDEEGRSEAVEMQKIAMKSLKMTSIITKTRANKNIFIL